MANKIFVSYKFSDNQVDQRLDIKYWAENAVEATARGYVNWMEDFIGREHIYKGESDGDDLSGKTDDEIWECLKPKVHDSTVTLIAISRGMKELLKEEKEQWIPQEVRYSLWEVERGDKTSTTNALLGVMIPDRNGSYDYIWGRSNCSHCQNIPMFKKDFLFKILHKNVFNKKEGDVAKCQSPFCGSTIYNGDHSYLHLVKFDDFKAEPNIHIEKALKLKEKMHEYNVEKSI